MSYSEQDDKKDFIISKKSNNMKKFASLKKSIKKLTYEESIAELEIILKNVQDENISLDQIQSNYIKGHMLFKHCEEMLQCVEQEINEINPDLFDIN
tara:strand:+ start:278 stop:568 length:291 start_codon:yes stop_codon:yes gene_type:complete